MYLFLAQMKILKRPTHLLFGRDFFSAGMKILPVRAQAPRPTTPLPTLDLVNRAGPLCLPMKERWVIAYLVDTD
jgi:hypothetical protein